MLSRATAGKLLKIAEKMRVMIIADSTHEVWDIKWALQNCAFEVDRGAEITSSGVAVKGFKPITVTEFRSVDKDKALLSGAVFVTDEKLAGQLHIDPENPVKIHLLPAEEGVNV